MKYRDNIAVFSTAMAALSLEFFLLAVLWLFPSRPGGPFDREKFMLFGQTYLLAACLAIYLAGRRFVKPLQPILEGIAQFGRGRLSHKIPPSRVKELDQISHQLNGMAARLLELDELKNDFVANVSHELRSPLAAMEGYVMLLLKEPASKLAGDNLSRLQDNLARLRRLVENLLDVSQIEARRTRVQPELVRLDAIAREVCALFGSRCEARRIALDLDIPAALPAAFADPARVRQILINLVDNSIKYNRDGGRVALSASESAGRLLLSVADTGPGIAPQNFESIFERFNRPPPVSAQTAAVKGAGLGLSISLGLARMLGGDITVESRLGAGTTFTLSLPLRREDR